MIGPHGENHLRLGLCRKDPGLYQKIVPGPMGRDLDPTVGVIARAVTLPDAITASCRRRDKLFMAPSFHNHQNAGSMSEPYLMPPFDAANAIGSCSHVSKA